MGAAGSLEGVDLDIFLHLALDMGGEVANPMAPLGGRVRVAAAVLHIAGFDQPITAQASFDGRMAGAAIVSAAVFCPSGRIPDLREWSCTALSCSLGVK